MPNSFFAQRKIMTSSVAHFVERIRTLFSGRAHVFVLKNKIQTVLFKKKLPDIDHISSITVSPVNLTTASSF